MEHVLNDLQHLHAELQDFSSAWVAVMTPVIGRRCLCMSFRARNNLLYNLDIMQRVDRKTLASTSSTLLVLFKEDRYKYPKDP